MRIEFGEYNVQKAGLEEKASTRRLRVILEDGQVFDFRESNLYGGLIVEVDTEVIVLPKASNAAQLIAIDASKKLRLDNR